MSMQAVFLAYVLFNSTNWYCGTSALLTRRGLQWTGLWWSLMTIATSLGSLLIKFTARQCQYSNNCCTMDESTVVVSEMFTSVQVGEENSTKTAQRHKTRVRLHQPQTYNQSQLPTAELSSIIGQTSCTNVRYDIISRLSLCFPSVFHRFVRWECRILSVSLHYIHTYIHTYYGILNVAFRLHDSGHLSLRSQAFCHSMPCICVVEITAMY